MAELSPAILTNDLSDFRMKYSQLFALSHFFTKLHVDFIDNTFVHNRTLLPAALSFLKSSPLTLIAHFMCSEPQKYFEDAKNSGFKIILFHFEAFPDKFEIDGVIASAKSLGLKVGIVADPETDLQKLSNFLPKVDMVQLMGIHPGFQGREFRSDTIDKVRQLRALDKNVIISVDGGVKIGIARKLAEAGANILVAGSAIFRAGDEQTAIEALKADIQI